MCRPVPTAAQRPASGNLQQLRHSDPRRSTSAYELQTPPQARRLRTSTPHQQGPLPRERFSPCAMNRHSPRFRLALNASDIHAMHGEQTRVRLCGIRSFLRCPTVKQCGITSSTHRHQLTVREHPAAREMAKKGRVTDDQDAVFGPCQQTGPKRLDPVEEIVHRLLDDNR